MKTYKIEAFCQLLIKDKIKIAWIGGSHSRHLYFLNQINNKFQLIGGILEKRENSMPEPPDSISELDRKNFIRHFKQRDLNEKKYFGNQDIPKIHILNVKENELNSEKSVQFINKLNPDLVIIFGCGLIKNPLFNVLPVNSINLHLGLSPRYRGSATLFWPFYFLEPNLAGTTFHYIVDEPDAGDIIHQSVPILETGDGIHDVSCKAVITATKDAIKLIEIFKSKMFFKRFKQRATGKNFLTNDFKPQHLRLIYNCYDDDIVDKFLEGKLVSKNLKLIKQF